MSSNFIRFNKILAKLSPTVFPAIWLAKNDWIWLVKASIFKVIWLDLLSYFIHLVYFNHWFLNFLMNPLYFFIKSFKYSSTFIILMVEDQLPYQLLDLALNRWMLERKEKEERKKEGLIYKLLLHYLFVTLLVTILYIRNSTNSQLPTNYLFITYFIFYLHMIIMLLVELLFLQASTPYLSTLL